MGISNIELTIKTTTNKAPNSWYGIAYSHKVTDGRRASFATANRVLNLYTSRHAPQPGHSGKSFKSGNLMGIQPVPQVWCDLVMTYSYINETDKGTQVVDTLFSQIETLIQKADAELNLISRVRQQIPRSRWMGLAVRILPTLAQYFFDDHVDV